MLEIEHYYSVEDVNDLDIWERQFNIPPREMAPIVFEQNGKRHLTAGLWSLLPPSAKRLDFANEVSTFNAKAETLPEKPTFRNAFLARRCVVPAEAFYEWIGPKRKRQPPPHLSSRRELSIDGRALQLLEAGGFGGKAHPYFHGRDS